MIGLNDAIDDSCVIPCLQTVHSDMAAKELQKLRRSFSTWENELNTRRHKELYVLSHPPEKAITAYHAGYDFENLDDTTSPGKRMKTALDEQSLMNFVNNLSVHRANFTDSTHRSTSSVTPGIRVNEEKV